MGDPRAPASAAGSPPRLAGDGDVRLRNRGRLPPLYVAMLLFFVGLYLSPLVTGDAPADADYWWLVPVFLIGGLTVPLSIFLYRVSASVTVTGAGLLVRDRLVVPVDGIGAVELLSGTNAAWASLGPTRTLPRVPGRQNLYGGGFGWGRGSGSSTSALRAPRGGCFRGRGRRRSPRRCEPSRRRRESELDFGLTTRITAAGRPSVRSPAVPGG